MYCHAAIFQNHYPKGEGKGNSEKHYNLVLNCPNKSNLNNATQGTYRQSKCFQTKGNTLQQSLFEPSVCPRALVQTDVIPQVVLKEGVIYRVFQ